MGVDAMRRIGVIVALGALLGMLAGVVTASPALAARGPKWEIVPADPFTLPGDTSASDRYYETDVTAPFVLDAGHLDVPTGPGLGVVPLPEVLDAVTTATEWIAC